MISAIIVHLSTYMVSNRTWCKSIISIILTRNCINKFSFIFLRLLYCVRHKMGQETQTNQPRVELHSYLVRQNVEFSLLLVNETGRNFSVMSIFLAQAESFLACNIGTAKFHNRKKVSFISLHLLTNNYFLLHSWEGWSWSQQLLGHRHMKLLLFSVLS